MPRIFNLMEIEHCGASNKLRHRLISSNAPWWFPPTPDGWAQSHDIQSLLIYLFLQCQVFALSARRDVTSDWRRITTPAVPRIMSVSAKGKARALIRSKVFSLRAASGGQKARCIMGSAMPACLLGGQTAGNDDFWTMWSFPVSSSWFHPTIFTGLEVGWYSKCLSLLFCWELHTASISTMETDIDVIMDDINCVHIKNIQINGDEKSSLFIRINSYGIKVWSTFLQFTVHLKSTKGI